VTRKRQFIRWAIAAALIVGAVLLVNLYVNHEAQSLARDMIAEHFHSDVQLDSLHVRLLPTVKLSGDGLTLAQTAEGARIPFIQVQHFTATTSLWNMLTRTRQLHHVRAQGLVITIKRHGEGELQQTSVHRKVPDFNIDELIADQATLLILPNDPAKHGLVFDMHHLVLTSIGKGDKMHYRAQMHNALPPGEIEAEGDIGPWNYDNTGATHVDGKYDFRKADLGVFHDISGTLSSQGTFSGALSKLGVQGTTDTPDFKVGSGGHPADLTTQFDATVDGTNGNTYLNSVEAHILRSSFSVTGLIYDVPGPQGHLIQLSVVSKDAQVEDMLNLAAKTAPAMTGQLKFEAQVKIVPGHNRIRDRIAADGHATIANGYFAKSAVEEKISELSHRAEGEHNASPDDRVPARFNTTFHLADGKLNLPSLDFNVPGAEAKLHGTYGLADESLDFTGVAMLHATVSQMTTGFKSLLLKAADPFFKSGSAGTVLPLTITGTRSDPKFKVEMKRLKDAKKEAAAN
jgi:hypothetical protein